MLTKTQTLFIHQLLSIIDESLKLNRYLIETHKAGPMSEEAYQKAIEKLDQIQERFAKTKANPGV